MDDATGMVRPGAQEIYTLRLFPDGRLAMRLPCNRGSGNWTAERTDDARGAVRFGTMATTRAACPPGRLGRLAGDMADVRSFVLANGRLHLALKVDAGIYVWAPAPDAAAAGRR